MLEHRFRSLENNTYTFSIGLGIVEIAIGMPVLLDPISTVLGLIGGIMSFAAPIATLSLLITTPDAEMQNLDDAEYSFPCLSDAGRRVLKDTAILTGRILVMTDSAWTLHAQIRAQRLKAAAIRMSKGLAVARH